MKKHLFRILALLMAFHFCGFVGYSYASDLTVIECESDPDEENKENKKEQKLNVLQLTYSLSSQFENGTISMVSHKGWISPSLEINIPPPDLG